MAKQPSGKNGNAHIRLIVLDAVIPEGDVGQIAQALQNALRPPVQQRPQPQAPQLPARSEHGGDSVEETFDDASNADEFEVKSPEPRREARPRRHPTPDIIDLSPELVTSLKKFADVKQPKSEVDRALFAVTWFCDNGADDGAGASHVYTCYKYLDWPVGKDKDFGAPLRALKKSDHLRSLDRGKYAVTTYGRQQLDKIAQD